jgi:hypothetical protein
MVRQASSQGALLSWRTEDAGKSEDRPVTGRIGVATSLHRANGQTSSGSFVTRKLAEPVQEEIANERGVSHVRTLRQDDTGEPDWLVQVCVSGQRAASVYRQGHAGNSRVGRLRSRGVLKWLEPDERKPSCPVLRGGSGSNAALLPDKKSRLSSFRKPSKSRSAERIKLDDDGRTERAF